MVDFTDLDDAFHGGCGSPAGKSSVLIGEDADRLPVRTRRTPNSLSHCFGKGGGVALFTGPATHVGPNRRLDLFRQFIAEKIVGWTSPIRLLSPMTRLRREKAAGSTAVGTGSIGHPAEGLDIFIAQIVDVFRQLAAGLDGSAGSVEFDMRNRRFFPESLNGIPEIFKVPPSMVPKMVTITAEPSVIPAGSLYEGA